MLLLHIIIDQFQGLCSNFLGKLWIIRLGFLKRVIDSSLGIILIERRNDKRLSKAETRADDTRNGNASIAFVTMNTCKHTGTVVMIVIYFIKINSIGY